MVIDKVWSGRFGHGVLLLALSLYLFIPPPLPSASPPLLISSSLHHSLPLVSLFLSLLCPLSHAEDICDP